MGNGIWEFSPTAGGAGNPQQAGDEYAAAEYDPLSQKIILVGRYGLYVYDPVTRHKTTLIDGTLAQEDPGYANHMVYYPPNQRMYYIRRGDGAVFELTLDRSNFANSRLTKLATTGPHPAQHQEPGYAYDAQNQVIGGGVTNGTFYAFQPQNRTWEARTIQGGAVGTMAFHAIAYDPINNVFYFLNNDRHTWAYRYSP